MSRDSVSPTCKIKKNPKKNRGYLLSKFNHFLRDLQDRENLLVIPMIKCLAKVMTQTFTIPSYTTWEVMPSLPFCWLLNCQTAGSVQWVAVGLLQIKNKLKKTVIILSCYHRPQTTYQFVLDILSLKVQTDFWTWQGKLASGVGWCEDEEISNTWFNKCLPGCYTLIPAHFPPHTAWCTLQIAHCPLWGVHFTI